MARLPWGGERWLVRGVCRGLFHRVRSRPVGSTLPGGGVPRRAVFPGEREWGGIAWEGRAPARPRSCQRALSSSWCSTFPEARRSRGGGGSERVGRRVGAVPGRDEHRLVRGGAGGWFIEPDRGPWARRSRAYGAPGGGCP